MEYNRDHLLDVVRTFFKWKRPILLVTMAAAVLTVLVSLLLPNYYEATTIFYAATPALQSPSVIFGESSKDLEFYGEGQDMDRLIQAAQSNELLNYMTEKFDLYEHYRIDTSSIKAKDKLRKKFAKHYTVVKNERDAIELRIEDKDREKAASMANVARDKTNEVTGNIIRGTQWEILKSFERQIDGKEKSLLVLADSLSALRERYGIYDAAYQREVVGMALPQLRGNIAQEKARLEAFEKAGRRDSVRVISARILGFEEKMKALTVGDGNLNMSKGLSQIDQLAQVEATIMEELGEDRAKYQKYKAAFDVPKPALFVQDHAEVPSIKSRPKRSLIVIGVTFLAFLFSLLGVLVLEYNQDVDWKSIVNTK